MVIKREEKGSVIVESLLWNGDLEGTDFDSGGIEHEIREAPLPTLKEQKAISDYIEKLEIETQMKIEESYVDEDLTQSFAGATNYKNSVILKQDFSFDLSTFKRGMHCSQEIVISYQNREGLPQRHGNMKITELKLSLIKDLLTYSNAVFINKKPPKESILTYFKENNITKKRCLVKCSSEIHGIALMKKYNELRSNDIKTVPKKKNNIFSNYARMDRPAGKMLVEEFIKKYGLSMFSASYKEIEVKADVSFDVYDSNGFIYYSSEQMKQDNVTFYKNGLDLYYVKAQYLDAFGKIVAKKSIQLKRLSAHLTSKSVLI